MARIISFMALWAIIYAAMPSNVNVPSTPPNARRQHGYLLAPVSRVKTDMDIFLGPFCKGSKGIFPTFQALAKATADRGLALRVHLFPLPHNHLSFIPAQVCVSAGIVVNVSKVIQCIEWLYAGDNQKTVESHALINYTVPQVIDELVDNVSHNVGIDKDLLAKQMAQGLEIETDAYRETMGDWKYGTSLGVTSTPSVFIDQVQIFGYDPSGKHPEGSFAGMTLDEWQTELKPVLSSRGRYRHEV